MYAPAIYAYSSSNITSFRIHSFYLHQSTARTHYHPSQPIVLLAINEKHTISSPVPQRGHRQKNTSRKYPYQYSVSSFAPAHPYPTTAPVSLSSACPTFRTRAPTSRLCVCWHREFVTRRYTRRHIPTGLCYDNGVVGVLLASEYVNDNDVWGKGGGDNYTTHAGPHGFLCGRRESRCRKGVNVRCCLCWSLMLFWWRQLRWGRMCLTRRN